MLKLDFKKEKLKLLMMEAAIAAAWDYLSSPFKDL